MYLTRRSFLVRSAAAGTLALAPARLWSATELDLGGGRQAISLSDGHLEMPPDFIFGLMDPAEAEAVKAAHGIGPGPLVAPCNVTLLRDGANTVLFDVGSGHDFQPTAGDLPDALEALGVAPEDITHVVFTHAHPDHLWGLLDEFDEPRYPEAAYLIGGTEFDYWTDPATVDTIGEARTTFAVGAKRRLDAIAEIMEMIAPGDSPVPGVTTRLTAGHTPGHCSFDLGGMLLLGDCIGNGHVAFDDPAALTGSDQDPAAAAETRLALMAELAGSGLPALGFHLPDGGIGRVVAEGKAYRFAPLG